MITDYYWHHQKYIYVIFGFILEFILMIFLIDWIFNFMIGKQYTVYQQRGFFISLFITAVWCSIIIIKINKAKILTIYPYLNA